MKKIFLFSGIISVLTFSSFASDFTSTKADSKRKPASSGDFICKSQFQYDTNPNGSPKLSPITSPSEIMSVLYECDSGKSFTVTPIDFVL